MLQGVNTTVLLSSGTAAGNAIPIHPAAPHLFQTYGLASTGSRGASTGRSCFRPAPDLQSATLVRLVGALVREVGVSDLFQTYG